MNRYRLLGYVVWRTVKWYLHRRLGVRRALARAAIALLAGVAASIRAYRRVAG